MEMERRKRLGRPVSYHSPFSAKIICGECGGAMRSTKTINLDQHPISQKMKLNSGF
jgi:hypothetical protein